MTAKKVPPHLLEALATDSLDEKERDQLLAILEEEEGGLQRLESLRAANRAFLEDYPPEVMVPRILNRAAEGTTNAQKRDNSLSLPPTTEPQARWLPYFVGAALLAVLALVAFFLPREAPQDLDGPLDPSSLLATSDEEAEAQEESSSPVLETREERVGGQERRESQTLRRLGLVVLAPAEMRQFPAQGVRRIEVENEDYLQVSMSQNGEVLFFRAVSIGETAVTLSFVNEEVHRLQVVISDSLGDESLIFYRGLFPGETQDLDLQGARRVIILNDHIVNMSTEEKEENLLEIEALKAGSTELHIFPPDQDHPFVFRFVVAPELNSQAYEEIFEERRPALSGCKTRSENISATFGILFSPDGEIKDLFAEEFRASSEELTCLTEEIRTWSFPAHGGEQNHLFRVRVPD